MRLVIALVAVAALSSVAGCGSDATPGGDASTSPVARYLHDLRAQDHYFDSVADDAIVELADRMCADMDAGKTLEEVNRGQYGLDASPEQVPLVFAFAIRARCPDHEDLLPGTPDSP